MHININITTQQLQCIDNNKIIFHTPVSTAKNGVGEQLNSGCTPRGQFAIYKKIGQDCADNTVFIGRKPTGEIYTSNLGENAPARDWILTRILWLTGLEQGKNLGGKCDTLQRYIYLHGCPDSCVMGVPASHGCIRLSNKAITTVFNLVKEGTKVMIQE